MHAGIEKGSARGGELRFVNLAEAIEGEGKQRKKTIK
jgi:hypothetical protein